MVCRIVGVGGFGRFLGRCSIWDFMAGNPCDELFVFLLVVATVDILLTVAVFLQFLDFEKSWNASFKTDL